jgi:hypothetical protein
VLSFFSCSCSPFSVFIYLFLSYWRTFPTASQFPGTANAPIVFAPYAGAKVLLDGTGLSFSGGPAAFVLSSAQYIVISGFEIANYRSGSTSDTPMGMRDAVIWCIDSFRYFIVWNLSVFYFL